MSYMGIDVGTNGTKATVISENGDIIYNDSQSYSLSISESVKAELSPEKVWEAFCTLIRKANQNLNQVDPIQAISFSILGEAITPIDRAGKPLDSTLVSMDYRGKNQNDRIKSCIDSYEIYLKTGQICHPMYPLSKILWWKEERPDLFSQTWKFLCWEDYLFYKLLGKPVMSYSLASRTMFFDLQTKFWLVDMLDKFNLKKDLFSNLAPSGKVIGNLTPTMSKILNMPKDTLLVTGGWDQSCAALGAGAIEESLFLESFGTTLCVGSLTQNLLLKKDLFQGGFPTNCFVIPDTYFINGGTLNGGILLKWFQKNIMKKTDGSSSEQNDFYAAIDQYDMIPSVEYFIPHFAGSGTPLYKPEDRGCILNLSYETDSMTIIKSLIESLGFEVRRNLEFLEQALKRKYTEVRLVGGGSKSEYICTLQSNIFNKEIRAFDYHDVSSYGAAILALAGVKGWSEALQILKNFINKTRKYYGVDKSIKLYNEKYYIYQKLTDVINSIHEIIHS